MESAAARLESDLAAARAELRRSSEETARALKAQRRSFGVQQTAFAYLQCLKKIRKKVYLKELVLVEQGLAELSNKRKGFA